VEDFKQTNREPRNCSYLGKNYLASALDYLTDGSERTIDTHIKNIRIKLGDSDWIDTVRGFGYRFNGKENE
jgi:DNA-binding response OmpR family regulator